MGARAAAVGTTLRRGGGWKECDQDRRLSVILCPLLLGVSVLAVFAGAAYEVLTGGTNGVPLKRRDSASMAPTAFLRAVEM